LCGLLGSVGSGFGLLRHPDTLLGFVRHPDTFLGFVAVDPFSLGSFFLPFEDYLFACVGLGFFFLIVGFLDIGLGFVFENRP